MAGAGATDGKRIPASIGVEQAWRRLQADDPPLLLDVREPWEFVQAHVPGAHLIHLGELERRLAEVPAHKPVLVICQSGQRSLAAASYLARAGFADVTNVDGGTGAWQERGYAVEGGPG
jgi:rhodanese-related sulfurtransferase